MYSIFRRVPFVQSKLEVVCADNPRSQTQTPLPIASARPSPPAARERERGAGLVREEGCVRAFVRELAMDSHQDHTGAMAYGAIVSDNRGAADDGAYSAGASAPHRSRARPLLAAAVVMAGAVAVVTRASIGGTGRSASAMDMLAREDGPDGVGGGAGGGGGGAVGADGSDAGATVALSALSANPFAEAVVQALSQVAADDFILFGHQEDNLEGQYFTNYDPFVSDKSDCHNATGSYPAVVGYDFATTIYDGIDLTKHVQEAYSHGSVVEFDFRANNPVTGGAYNNITGEPCKEICKEGTTAHDK